MDLGITVSPWHWVALLGVIAVLLSVDLLLHRGNEEPTAKHALVESAVWVACGLGFSLVVLLMWGGPAFGEYLSGYVIEKSLSIDNVFVWAVIFSSFAIPPATSTGCCSGASSGPWRCASCSSSPAPR